MVGLFSGAHISYGMFGFLGFLLLVLIDLCFALCFAFACFDLVMRDLAGLLGQNSGQGDSKRSQ